MFEKSDVELWALVVGTFLPLVISALIRCQWSARAKQLAAFGLCIVAGFGTAYFAGAFTGRSVLGCVMMVLLTAHVTYRTLWHPSGIAPAIERATDQATEEAG